MSIALLPGSYDPITNGHLDIVRRAAAVYDEVVVAVMNNDAKTYQFTMQQREALARAATAELARVRVVSDSGMLVDLFDKIGATVIVKGVRNEKDRAYENEMAAFNLSRNPRARTELWQASEGLADVSSTRVRAMLASGEVPEGLLPPAVIALLQEWGVLREGE